MNTEVKNKAAVARVKPKLDIVAAADKINGKVDAGVAVALALATPSPAPAPPEAKAPVAAPSAPAPAQQPAAPSPAPAPAPTPPPATAQAKTSLKPTPDAEDVEVDPLLMQILTTCRSHESPGDHNFRTWLIATLKTYGYMPRVSAPGNIIVETDSKSTTLFSSHVDTCHAATDSTGVKQSLMLDPGLGHLFLDTKSTSRCLGADDGAGVFIMMKMIQNKIPGTYVFHVGEERGGIGSHALLKAEPKFIERFDRAIAFDRAGETDVIYMQGGRECASMEATKWLCDQLNATELFSQDYEPSNGGSFTDTKVYRDIIPECFNISVGYKNQHGPKETQDIRHLERLLIAALQIKWDKMPTKRNPAVSSSGNGYGGGYGAYGGYESKGYTPAQHQMPAKTALDRMRMGEEATKSRDLFDGYDNHHLEDRYTTASKSSAANEGKRRESAPAVAPQSSVLDEIADFSYDDMMNFTQDYPDDAARAIWLMMAKLRGLTAEIEVYKQMLGE